MFCWLDWDGDNVLADGSIIDYGSVRQFGLYHREYRFEDVDRMSTTIPEQRRKARGIVQKYAQIRDFLVTGVRSPLQSFARDPVLDLFDAEFHRAWQRVEAYIDAQAPEFILMQCGADSLEGDPITHLAWTEEAHAHAASRLCRLAEKHCAGRIIGTGGGGYNRRNVARAWTRVVQSFVET